MLPIPGLYRIKDDYRILTPALLIYPAFVDANIQATLNMASGDPNRWRPHIKTAKIPFVIRRLIDYGVKNFKCSTTLELLTACESGAPDVLLAFPVMGANASRTLEIARSFPATRVSVLIETTRQMELWKDTDIGIFLDINSGMNRTGIRQDRVAEMIDLAAFAGPQFRGVHYYDGHMAGVSATERQKHVQEGYGHLMNIVQQLWKAGLTIGEVITSGTPAAPYALSYVSFSDAPFIHRISPGTVVYNDLTSLEQLPGWGYRPAALVLTTVISHPRERTVTCDAGHKSVSVDAGVPNCSVLEYEHLKPLKPSEEHLPMESESGEGLPEVGENLYLIPRHVCPTVNNFDEALFVVDGQISSVERVAARGHEQRF
ncbi:MAG: alanine racemase [Acidobacteriaceae bacterium]|nr:alanine racemase [Acidobacteriaceae bacterium]